MAMFQFMLVLLCAISSLEFVLKSKDDVPSNNVLSGQSSRHHLPLIQDDILMPTEFRGPAFRSVSGQRWPGGIIPYVLDVSVSRELKAVIMESIADFDNYTCVKWLPKTDDANWVQFYQTTNDSICGSVNSVGTKSGVTRITIQCIDKTTVVHEMMHSMGFLHEHGRDDRDKSMDMMYHNMVYARDEFDVDHSDHLGLPYDPLSLMHKSLSPHDFYGTQPYSMLAKDPCEAVGSAHRKYSVMSRLDKIKVNKYYGCDDIHGISETSPEKEYDLGRVWSNGTTTYQCFMDGDEAIPRATSCMDLQNKMRYRRGSVFSVGEYECVCDINSAAKEAKIIILSGCDSFTYTEWIMGRFVYNYECDRSEKKLSLKIVGCTTPMNWEPKEANEYVPEGIVRNGERIDYPPLANKKNYYCMIYQNGTKARTLEWDISDDPNITKGSPKN